MLRIVCFLLLIVAIGGLWSEAEGDNIYELRKLTEDEWLSMSTEERLRALSTTVKHEENRTYIGDFGRFYNLYDKWG